LVLSEFPTINKTERKDGEELEQLKSGIKINELLQKKEKQFYKPRLGAQLDLGSQEFDFGFDPYVLLGINLEINLYDGARHKFRKDQNKSTLAAIQMRHDHLEDQFELRSATSLNNLESAMAQARTFAPRIDHAKKMYQEILVPVVDFVITVLKNGAKPQRWISSFISFHVPGHQTLHFLAIRVFMLRRNIIPINCKAVIITGRM